ncbi:hypothetical protein [Serratia marcescens]|uniref:hypothetical protein n=1 Tax=Serratia marcescens TaxID=615 RepID=UPI003FA7EDCD
MTTIEMIKNLAQRNSVVASADVLAVFTELEASKKSNAFLKEQLAKLANFNPDWDMLEACRESWREVAAALKEAEGRLEAKDERIAELDYIRASLSQVLVEFGDELGCNPDNESIMMAIDALKERLATPVRLPNKNDDEFWFDGVFQVAKFDRAVERAIRAAGFTFTVEGDE